MVLRKYTPLAKCTSRERDQLVFALHVCMYNYYAIVSGGIMVYVNDHMYVLLGPTVACLSITVFYRT